MTPIEAFQNILGYNFLQGRRIPNVPGALIEYACGSNQEMKNAISELKSEHFDKMKLEKFMFEDEFYYRKKRLSDLLCDFDKKMK
jgi:hypothetical protein